MKLSNENTNKITNKIGLFILWELIKTKRKRNFMLRKDKKTKLYFRNYLSFLKKNLKIIDLFLKKPLGCELIDCCKTNHIKIQILKKIKKIYYIITRNIKYFQTPIEMILKSEIEKIINNYINII